MEAHTALWMWTAAAGIFAAGLLMGLFIGWSRWAVARRAKGLESALRQSREEFTQYREQVAQHFLQAADLLHTLTVNYRAVHDHLAVGAQTLCDGQVRTLTPDALRERLLPETQHEATLAAHASPLPSAPIAAGDGQPPLRGADLGKTGPGEGDARGERGDERAPGGAAGART